MGIFEIAIGVVVGLMIFYKLKDTWEDEEAIRNWYRCGYDKVRR